LILFSEMLEQWFFQEKASAGTRRIDETFTAAGVVLKRFRFDSTDGIGLEGTAKDRDIASLSIGIDEPPLRR
jgi:hypothetical protein